MSKTSIGGEFMNVNWANVFNWMMLLKCFVTGGLICIIGQILIDKTKLTPAKILVTFVTAGAILRWNWCLSILS